MTFEMLGLVVFELAVSFLIFNVIYKTLLFFTKPRSQDPLTMSPERKFWWLQGQKDKDKL